MFTLEMFYSTKYFHRENKGILISSCCKIHVDIEIDQQSTLFLSLPIFPLIEDWKTILSQCVIFCFLFLKKEKKKEKNLQKYYPPILLKPTDIRKRTCNAESQKGSAVSELSNA